MRNARSEEALRENLRQVEDLLDRQDVLAQIAHRQEVPNRELIESLQRRQNVAELRRRIAGLHPADLAYILEALPPERRLLVWHEADPARAGAALAELSDPVGTALAEATPRDDLRRDPLRHGHRRPRVHRGQGRARCDGGRVPLARRERTLVGGVVDHLAGGLGRHAHEPRASPRPRGMVPRTVPGGGAPARGAPAQGGCALRRGRARGVARRAAGGDASPASAGSAGARGDARGAGRVRARGPGGPGRGGVRALRPGVGPRGRRPRQAAGTADRRRGDGLPAPPRRAADAPSRRPQRRGGPLCPGLAERAQPLHLAGRQPGHRLSRLAGHRRLRGARSRSWWRLRRSCPSWPAWAATRETRPSPW